MVEREVIRKFRTCKILSKSRFGFKSPLVKAISWKVGAKNKQKQVLKDSGNKRSHTLSQNVTMEFTMGHLTGNNRDGVGHEDHTW